MKEIIQWSKLFNDKSFKYNVLSNNLKDITSYNLAKIIYPDLTRKNFYKIINFIIKNIKIRKKRYSYGFWLRKWSLSELF